MNDSHDARQTRLTAVTIPGPAGALEGLLQRAGDGAPRLVALVCHPHPLYGGTLHNKVVHRVAATLHEMGAAVLRFNFRGVGASEGHYDQGRGERDDARAALEWLRAQFPGAREWLAGFSFGSWVAARLAAGEPRVERLILIAPPVRTSRFDVLRTAAVPKLVVQGSADEICRPEDLAREFPTWAEPRELREVAGASHFFDRQLAALGEVLREALGKAAREAPHA